MKLLARFNGKMDYLLREIVFYGFTPAKINFHLFQPDFAYQEIDQIEDIKDLKFKYDLQDYIKRFEKKHILGVWRDQHKVVCYCWINPNEKHILGELDLEMNLENKVEVIYDGFTDEEYRGKGLYSSLLQKFCLRNSKPKLGYAFANKNFGSIRGIEKAGFHFLGTISGYNKKRYKLLLKKLWQE